MKYVKDIEIEQLLKAALQEDIGERDITTQILIPKQKKASAVILVNEDCVICGLGIFAQILKLMDKNIKFNFFSRDGDLAKKREKIARIYGSAKAILTSERVGLNFLTHLSGIATSTRRFVLAVEPFKAKILDTRKTTPGLRILEKYAVRVGGGYNHRMGLDDMILVKDNHLKVLGSKLWSLGFWKKSRRIKTEIEVKTLREFIQALKLKPDIILLDNMDIEGIKKAVKIRNSLSPEVRNLTPKLEASGGITLKNVKHVASTGVDMISIGELTHSAPSIDISLEIL